MAKGMTQPPELDTAIADTGASSFYLTPKAPCTNINPTALQVLVGTTGGPPHRSSAFCGLLQDNLPVVAGHSIPNFHHNLMGIGPLCNHNCPIVFENKTVTVFPPENNVLLRGWREKNGAKIWHFALRPKGHIYFPENWSNGPTAMNAHDLPIFGALVRYLHACAGFPVRSTWLAAINSGNYASWPGLMFANAAKYCPVSVESLKVHRTKPGKGIAPQNTSNPLNNLSPTSPVRYLQSSPNNCMCS